MKAVIFAGGVGTRLWPLSRQKSPKQFEKIVGDKSTLQLTVSRLLPEFKPANIFISTGKKYLDIVAKQLPMIPKENIIGEPIKRDVGPAVALAMGYIAKKSEENEPVIILWSDHMVQHEKKFKNIILTAEQEIRKNAEKIIFIGQKPRFASENLGWIEYGEVLRKSGPFQFNKFSHLKYKPDREIANQYFADGHHCWNLGYFISTPHFVLNLFKEFAPGIHKLVKIIVDAKNQKDFVANLDRHYKKMPELSFDNAILEQLDRDCAEVIVEDIGWSDVGAWEALKESLGKNAEDNITKGRVLLEDSADNLVYNYEDKKLVVGIDLEDFLVVNTRDVLLVAKKSSVSKVKKLVEGFQGTELEHLT